MLAEQTRDFFRDMKPAIGPDIGVGFSMSRLSMGQRIAALQGDPELAAKFLDKSSFEKVVRGPIEDLLLNPVSETARQYGSNLKQFEGGDDAMRAVGERIASNLLVDPLAGTAGRERAFKVGEQSILLRDLSGGEAGVTREGLTRLLRSTGRSAMSDRMIAARFELGTQFGKRHPSEVAEEMLLEEAQRRETPREGSVYRRPRTFVESIIPAMAGGGQDVATIPPTARDLDIAQTLREVADHLANIRATNSKMAQESPAGPLLVPAGSDR